jgi:hypothetical protein
LAVSDFNRDGIPDLVTANHDSQDVTVLLGKLGKVDGTFEKPQSFPTGNPPDAVTVDDFNGDGIPDLATANSESDDVSVLLGNGNGTFKENSRFGKERGVGAGPTALVSGNFNGDGIHDLAIVNYLSSDVSILLGRGKGASPEEAFVGPSNLAVPLRSTPVRLIDGSGKLTVAVLRGDGRILLRKPDSETGAFGPPTILNSNPCPPARDLAVVRSLINGRPPVGPAQAALSLAALDADSSTISLYVPGNKDGTSPCERRVGPKVPDLEPVRLLTGDLNGDGSDDLVIVGGGSNQVFVYLQKTSGGFGSGPDYTKDIGPGFADMVLADANGDGRPDIVIANRFSGDVRVLLNDKEKPFQNVQSFRAGLGLFAMDKLPDKTFAVRALLEPAGLAAGAFQAGKPTDLVVTASAANSFALLHGDGAGGFLNPDSADVYQTGTRPTTIVAGQLTNDPDLDLVVLNAASKTVSIFRGDGLGGFKPLGQTGAGTAPTGLTLADVNGDGNLDLLVGNSFGDVLFKLGNGDGTFREPQPADKKVNLAVADLTRNSQDNFLFTDENQNRVAVQKGLDAPSPLPPPPDGKGFRAPGAVTTADLNGDGLRDAIVANSGGNDVVVYLGTPGGGFAPPQVFPVGTDPVSVTVPDPKVSDLNKDGLPDLVVADKGSNDVAILLSQKGPGGWTLTPGPRLGSGGMGPVATAVSDVTGPNGRPDGIPDILVSNSLSNQVALLPGLGGGFFDDQAPRTFDVGLSPGPIFPLPGPIPGVITVNAGSNNVTLIKNLLGNGQDEFIATHGDKPVAALLDDVNGDGLLDLVIAHQGDGRLSLLTGEENGFSFADVLETGLGHLSGLADSVFGPNFYVTAEGIADQAFSFVFGVQGSSPVSRPIPEALPGSEFSFVPTLVASASEPPPSTLVALLVVGPGVGSLEAEAGGGDEEGAADLSPVRGEGNAVNPAGLPLNVDDDLKRLLQEAGDRIQPAAGQGPSEDISEPPLDPNPSMGLDPQGAVWLRIPDGTASPIQTVSTQEAVPPAPLADFSLLDQPWPNKTEEADRSYSAGVRLDEALWADLAETDGSLASINLSPLEFPEGSSLTQLGIANGEALAPALLAAVLFHSLWLNDPGPAKNRRGDGKFGQRLFPPWAAE